MSDCKTDVLFETKKAMGRSYGKAFQAIDVIQIREDLPEHVKAFVVCHELYHLQDNSKHWLWREIKATVAGVVWPVMGLIHVLWDFVVKKERRDFMIDRIRKGY